MREREAVILDVSDLLRAAHDDPATMPDDLAQLPELASGPIRELLDAAAGPAQGHELRGEDGIRAAYAAAASSWQRRTSRPARRRLAAVTLGTALSLVGVTTGLAAAQVPDPATNVVNGLFGSSAAPPAHPVQLATGSTTTTTDTSATTAASGPDAASTSPAAPVSKAGSGCVGASRCGVTAASSASVRASSTTTSPPSTTGPQRTTGGGRGTGSSSSGTGTGSRHGGGTGVAGSGPGSNRGGYQGSGGGGCGSGGGTTTTTTTTTTSTTTTTTTTSTTTTTTTTLVGGEPSAPAAAVGSDSACARRGAPTGGFIGTSG